MLRSFTARGIYCLKLVGNGFTHPGGNKTFKTSRKRLMSSRGMFTYDSITVSSAWELTSVSMRYSQGEGVITSLYRIMYCTHVVCLLVLVYILIVFGSVPFLCGVYGYLPWHGHVLPGTPVIKIMCGN